MDSDDQNLNNKTDEANGGVVNSENMKYTFRESLRKNQCVDKNGNTEMAENLNNNYFSGSGDDSKDDDDNGNGNVNPKKPLDQKALRLQAMAMSDDDDYGE